MGEDLGAPAGKRAPERADLADRVEAAALDRLVEHELRVARDLPQPALGLAIQPAAQILAAVPLDHVDHQAPLEIHEPRRKSVGWSLVAESQVVSSTPSFTTTPTRAGSSTSG